MAGHCAATGRRGQRFPKARSGCVARGGRNWPSNCCLPRVPASRRRKPAVGGGDCRMRPPENRCCPRTAMPIRSRRLRQTRSRNRPGSGWQPSAPLFSVPVIFCPSINCRLSQGPQRFHDMRHYRSSSRLDSATHHVPAWRHVRPRAHQHQATPHLHSAERQTDCATTKTGRIDPVRSFPAPPATPPAGFFISGAL